MKHFCIAELGYTTKKWEIDRKYNFASVSIPKEIPTDYVEEHEEGQPIPTSTNKRKTLEYYKTEIKGYWFWKKSFHYYK